MRRNLTSSASQKSAATLSTRSKDTSELSFRQGGPCVGSCETLRSGRSVRDEHDKVFWVNVAHGDDELSPYERWVARARQGLEDLADDLISDLVDDDGRDGGFRGGARRQTGIAARPSPTTPFNRHGARRTRYLPRPRQPRSTAKSCALTIMKPCRHSRITRGAVEESDRPLKHCLGVNRTAVVTLQSGPVFDSCLFNLGRAFDRLAVVVHVIGGFTPGGPLMKSDWGAIERVEKAKPGSKEAGGLSPENSPARAANPRPQTNRPTGFVRPNRLVRVDAGDQEFAASSGSYDELSMGNRRRARSTVRLHAGRLHSTQSFRGAGDSLRPIRTEPDWPAKF